ncbi:MAG TPA: biopolymer transporter ExbD [Candidatus Angelobacter sp.]
MAMMLGGRRTVSSEINVTPMIDVLLVLLIIFMVVFPNQSVGERAEIPQKGDAPQGVEKPVVIHLKDAAVGQRPSLKINEEEVSWENLEARLQKIYSGRIDKVAFVQGDPEIDFQYVAEAIDVTHHAGAAQVGLLGN